MTLATPPDKLNRKACSEAANPRKCQEYKPICKTCGLFNQVHTFSQTSSGPKQRSYHVTGSKVREALGRCFLQRVTQIEQWIKYTMSISLKNTYVMWTLASISDSSLLLHAVATKRLIGLDSGGLCYIKNVCWSNQVSQSLKKQATQIIKTACLGYRLSYQFIWRSREYNTTAQQ